MTLKSGKKILNVKSYLEGDKIKLLYVDKKIEYISKGEVLSIEPGPIQYPQITQKEEVPLEEIEKSTSISESTTQKPIPSVPIYYSLLPFYSASFTRGQYGEGISLVSSKLFFLFLYSKYRNPPEDVLNNREIIFLYNTSNRIENDTLRPVEALVRFNFYDTLQEDTVDPFSGATITKQQYTNRQNVSLGLFLAVTFLDLFLNTEVSGQTWKERQSFQWKTFTKRDPILKAEEVGVQIDCIF
ncbi:hypothetical protein [Leptospira ryugenii]|uniref:hypothetical protein n=1 Tax=Leptospira ryugenii TaxID=1917863 RepID=UPI001AE94F32|nr:hypothetical protein [Leptospira ryugenii]